MQTTRRQRLASQPRNVAKTICKNPERQRLLSGCVDDSSTKCPVDMGGRRSSANQQKKDPVGPARVPTGSSGKERTVSQAAPDSPSLVATGKGGVRRCAAYCSPWWCETCKFPVTGSRSPNPGDNLAVLQTSLTAFGDDSLTTAGERGEALATRRRR